MRFRDLLDRINGTEIVLRGGMATRGVVRVGDAVRRPISPTSGFVHDLLRHLELGGFDRVPRFLGTDEKGRATLTYVAGTVHHRVGGFRREQWLAAARLLRQLHDATADCELKGNREIVCHGDPWPGNYVFRDGMPYGLIDFDSARAGSREEDVGYAAWMWLYIGNRRRTPEEQGSMIMDFVTAYDPAPTWSPLESVIQAQSVLVGRLPKGLRWLGIRMWAKSCMDWTERNRVGIAAGIAMRTDNSPGR